MRAHCLAARTSIADYSGKEKDTWGQYQLIERGYSDKASISTIVMSGMVDPVSKLLKTRRAKPTLCIASDQYNSLVLFGLISSTSPFRIQRIPSAILKSRGFL